MSMRRLANAIRDAGFRTHNWRYHSRLYRLLDHIDHFSNFIEQLDEHDAPVHFVGHSFGSLVIRGATAEPLPVTSGRIVMIAPPNRGAGIAERFGNTMTARWFYGKPVRDLSKGAPSLDRLGLPLAEYGVIAGSHRFHLLNPISYINAIRGLEYEHDGTVEIENTRLPDMKDFLIVTAHHTFICNHPDTVEQTITFLRTGAFEHPGPDM